MEGRKKGGERKGEGEKIKKRVSFLSSLGSKFDCGYDKVTVDGRREKEKKGKREKEEKKKGS